MKKIRWLILLICFLLSVLLTAPGVQEARKIFSALTWIIFLFLITASLFPERRGWKHLIRILAIVLLAPLAMNIIFAVGDAVTAYIMSAPSQTIKTVANTGKEIYRICQINNFSDLKDGKPFYMALVGAMVISLLTLLILVLRDGAINIFTAKNR